MNEIIIAIALWCANPNALSPKPMEIYFCKKELLKCVKKNTLHKCVDWQIKGKAIERNEV